MATPARTSSSRKPAQAIDETATGPSPFGSSSPHLLRTARNTLGGALIGLLAAGVCMTLSPAVAAQSAAASSMPSSVGTTTALASMSAVGLPAWPVLRQGPNDVFPLVTVRSLQYLLNAHGARLAVDGLFGTKTDAAVRAFQRAHGLVVDGVVGQQTWSAVIVTVRRGSAGPAVEGVQDQANFRNGRGDGSLTLQVDGVFGPRTEAWVRGFQSAVAHDVPGFVVDGIVGPMTWQALVTETLSG